MTTRSQTAARGAALLAIAIGLLAVAGWQLRLPVLLQISSHYVPIAPNTAVGLVLAGIAVWLQATPRSDTKRRWSAYLAAIVCLLGAVTLVEITTGRDLGIDRLVFVRGESLFGPTAYRMSVPSAVAFFGIGAALSLSVFERAVLVVELLAVCVGLIALTMLSGYAFGGLGSSATDPHKPMALHTAAAFLAVAIGTLLVAGGSFSRLVASDSRGGNVIREVVPLALAMLIVLDWCRLAAERAGLYGPAIGDALMTAGFAAVVIAILWPLAARLVRADDAASRAAMKRAVAEQNARAAARYARTLLETSLDPLVTISPDGKITDVNLATEDATGVSREAIIGTDFADYFTDPATARAGYQRVFRDQAVRDYPLELRHRDGRVMSVLYNASVYRDAAGSIVGIFAAARDITARKGAEEEVRRLNAMLEQRVIERTAQLEASNQELEAFAYSVAHDLRAPLRQIDGFARLLADEHAGALSPEASRFLSMISGGTRRMGTLIDELLTLTRLGRAALRGQQTGLATIVAAAIEQLRAEVPERQIEWRVRDLPFVVCDPALIRQVFDNLLSNAVKFTRPREHAVIEIGTVDGATPLTVYVRDNGVGFDMRYVDRLFGVFQRLHRMEDFEGNGVGLATVQRIVQKHGGRVWAEGRLNEGATFFFSLPDLQVQAAEPPVVAASAS